MKYQLEKRLIKFSTVIIVYCKKLNTNHTNKSTVNQLIRSATSIGANYIEANNSSSYKDFRHKISISLKEANETKYWLNILKNTEYNHNIFFLHAEKECQEIIKILQTITTKLYKNRKKK